jgi:hypothetical protein
VAVLAGVLAVLSGVAISAQDKYTLQVPGGLAIAVPRPIPVVLSFVAGYVDS